MERKCPNCNTWNSGTHIENCESCGTLISPEKIREKRDEEFEKERFKPPTKFELWLEKVKNSKNPLVKGVYYIFYSVYMIFMGIVTVVLYLIAGPSG